MGFNGAAIDRLLPRHEPASTKIEWNVHLEKVALFKKAETSTTGEIVDLSLEGALVLVPATEEHEIGDRVAVRFRGTDAVAEVRHRRAAEHPVKKLLYGVRFLPDRSFSDLLADEIGMVRGHRGELAEAWARAN